MVQKIRNRKMLPIGIENFEKIITEGFYYVDKTAFIRDLLNAWGEVNLFTRPRRFGKTLNMSMLKSFLEIGTDSTLFDGLVISHETEICENYMGKFPVIFISLKSVNASEYQTARNILCQIIVREALRFEFLLSSEELTAKERELYQGLTDFRMRDEILMGSLYTLSGLLYRYYGKKVIILIDEYDVPLSKANDNGYYSEMVNLIRGLFDQALKTNNSLYFAVLTGCLRVSKESIFTGLNNPRVLSVTSVRFDEYFGFTDREVCEMLEYYDLQDKYDTVKEWYDGYLFGNASVYCPWDVINYLDELTVYREARPKDYWSNTSGNDIIRHFIENAGDGGIKSEIEELVAGGNVTKVIHEEMTYNRLYDSIENIWSVLFMTGYLTQTRMPEGKQYQLKIPNREIRYIFINQIMELFRENVKKDGKRLGTFCDALKSGDAEETERLFISYLNRTISIRDTYIQKEKKENFYHGILLGILGFKEDWNLMSNAETGEGYSDIMVEIENEDIGIIIEVKYAENSRYAAAIEAAFDQIRKKNYTERLKNEGYTTIYKYGIACFKKKCRVRCEKEIFLSAE